VDLPSGVTLFGRAFTDQYLLSVADALQRQKPLSLPGGSTIEADSPRMPPQMTG
jgi:allophanate hydrolase